MNDDIEQIKIDAEFRGEIKATLGHLETQLVGVRDQITSLSSRKDEIHNQLWSEVRRVEGEARREISSVRRDMGHVREEVTGLDTKMKIWGGMLTFAGGIVSGSLMLLVGRVFG